jgi:hypothetical protein
VSARVSAPSHFSPDQKAEWYQERWDLISQLNQHGRRTSVCGASDGEASASATPGKALPVAAGFSGLNQSPNQDKQGAELL